MAPAAPEPDLDALLLRVGRDRDEDAYHQLYAHLAPRLRGWLRKGRTPEVAVEELVQETLWTVWRQAHRFDPDRGKATSWIFTIARNRRVDRIRKEARPALDPDDPALVPTPPGAQPEEQHDQTWRSDRVHSALEKLPAEQLEIMRAAYFEQLTQRQIAEHSGVPIGTVKSRVRLALKHMKRTMPDEVDPT